MTMSRVAEWEIAKHMAIELYPLNLKAQQLFIKNKMGEKKEEASPK